MRVQAPPDVSPQAFQLERLRAAVQAFYMQAPPYQMVSPIHCGTSAPMLRSIARGARAGRRSNVLVSMPLSSARAAFVSYAGSYCAPWAICNRGLVTPR